MKIRVAVDAMGGDRAPEEIVAGAVAAASESVEPVLFGRRELLEPLAQGLEVVARCPTIASFIERHPEYQSLVRNSTSQS